MRSVIRAYPNLPGPGRGKGRKDEERKRADSLTSVERAVSVIAGVQARAEVGGLWEERERLYRIEMRQK